MELRTNPLQMRTQSRRATISATPLHPPPCSPQPNGNEGVELGSEPFVDHQSKRASHPRNRRATLSGPSFTPKFTFVLNAVKKLKSIPGRLGIQKLGQTPQSATSRQGANQTTVPETSSNPSTQTDASEDSPTSNKSVQFSDTKETIHPQQQQHTSNPGRARHSPNGLPKPALKRRSPDIGEFPPSNEDILIRDTRLALDSIICELVACVKEFKCPTELDFSASVEEALVLKNNEKNRPFINQLRRLDGLRTRLTGIQTHHNAQLEDKQRVIGVAIECALQRMKEYQLELRESKWRTRVHGTTGS